MYGPRVDRKPRSAAAAPKQPRSPTRPRRRPVGLAALRGFEAAARRLSFTLAADELALTQSSVSRQIAMLEHQVGQPLFVRKTRALELTPAGARLHAAVTQALAAVDACIDSIRGTAAAPHVALSTYASFASLWLVPRLASFQRAHPDIEIRIDASDRMVDLAAESFDVAIRRCRPRQLGTQDGVTLLHEEQVLPALSPALARRERLRRRTPADLARLPLIELNEPWSSARSGNWARWFEHAGVDAPTPRRLTFGFVDQCVQAAARGQGAVLGRTPLLDDALAAGQLMLPYAQLAMPTGYNVYLIVNPARAAAPEVTAFALWLRQQFAGGARA
jgi:DNA-binding transcriptional LysR family regulator